MVKNENSIFDPSLSVFVTLNKIVILHNNEK